MTRGASASFARAAEEALEAFRKRAERYDEASDDIRLLAIEMVRKILGTEPDIAGKDIERILERGLSQLRARRRVRVQLPTGRRNELRDERPNLMKAVAAQPDLVLEDADDVRLGFARVVTEVGGALCAEESVLDAVARAVNVRETPRPRGASAGSDATHAVPVRTDIRAAYRPSTAATGDASSLGDDDDSDEALGARAGHDVSDDDDDDDDDSSDLTSRIPEGVMRVAAARVAERGPPARTAVYDDLPDAAVELDPSSQQFDDDDEEDDATRALPARSGGPSSSAGGGARPLPSPGSMGRSPAASPSTLPLLPSAPRPTARGSSPPPERAVRPDRVPTGRVQAGGRAATKVLRVDEREALVARARGEGPARVDLGADDDDDMDLYTDDRPPRRK
jgi:hypothetical protein